MITPGFPPQLTAPTKADPPSATPLLNVEPLALPALFGTVEDEISPLLLVYIMQYSNKYNIPIPQKEALSRMANRIHDLINEIEPRTDDRTQPSKNHSSDEEEYRTKKSMI